MVRQLLLLPFLVAALAGAEPLAGTRDGDDYVSIERAVRVRIPAGTPAGGIRDRADGQGITNQAVFLQPDGSMYGLVTTRIRTEFPQDATVLERTASRFRHQIRAEDGSVLEYLEPIVVGDERALVAVVRHFGVGQPLAFRDRWLDKEDMRPSDMLEVRLYAVHNGYFIEFKRLFWEPTVPGVTVNAAAQAEARRLLAFALASDAVAEPLRAPLSAYDTSKEFIRWCLPDPSVEPAAAP